MAHSSNSGRDSAAAVLNIIRLVIGLCVVYKHKRYIWHIRDYEKNNTKIIFSKKYIKPKKRGEKLILLTEFANGRLKMSKNILSFKDHIPY